MLLKHATVLRPGFGLIAALLLVSLQAAAWVHDVSPKLYIQFGKYHSFLLGFQCFLNRRGRYYRHVISRCQLPVAVSPRTTCVGAALLTSVHTFTF
jgi:hypothetical protein